MVLACNADSPHVLPARWLVSAQNSVVFVLETIST